MKQLKSALLMLTICVMALGACKKDKDEETSAAFSVKVDGSAKSVIRTPTAVLMDETLQIIAPFSNNASISLMITNPKVGTFDVAADDVIVSYQPTNGLSDGYMGYEGKIVVTEYTGSRIKGTFEFKAEHISTDALTTVTEGKFDLQVSKM